MGRTKEEEPAFAGPRPLSLVGMAVGGRGMFVGLLTMFVSRGCVLLALYVLAEIVMVGRLMVMMRGGVVVRGRLVVRLACRMLRCLCHSLAFLQESDSSQAAAPTIVGWRLPSLS